MKNYKCYIFDFDGTLADSKRNIVNSLNFAATDFGLQKVKSHLIVPLIGKMNIESTFLYFYPHLDASSLTSLTSLFRTYQRENAHEEVELFPHVRRMLKTLRRQQKQLVILTTKNTSQVKYLLKILKIRHYFSFVMGESLYVNAPVKPHKECLSEISSRIGCSAEQYLMIGDSIVDCLFAKNCHIDMYGVSFGVDSPATLRKSGALKIINSYVELL